MHSQRKTQLGVTAQQDVSHLNRRCCVHVSVCCYPESIIIVVLVCWTGGRWCGRFTSRRWRGIMGSRVPTQSQLGLVDGGQLVLLAHAWLALGPKRCFNWLLAAGKPRIWIHHLLHLCKQNKWLWQWKKVDDFPLLHLCLKYSNLLLALLAFHYCTLL